MDKIGAEHGEKDKSNHTKQGHCTSVNQLHCSHINEVHFFTFLSGNSNFLFLFLTLTKSMLHLEHDKETLNFFT